MPELVIGGIVLGPIIMALVQVFKHYGLPSKWAPWANLVLSFLAGALVLMVQANPEYQNAVVLFLQVAMLFLSASGTYTTGKWAWEQATK